MIFRIYFFWDFERRETNRLINTTLIILKMSVLNFSFFYGICVNWEGCIQLVGVPCKCNTRTYTPSHAYIFINI